MKIGLPSVRASIALLALSLPVVGGWGRVAQRTPADAARELIAADNALAAKAAGDDLVTAMSRAYARDVVVPDRAANGFARGRDAAIALLRRDTLAARSRLSWTPIRAGVSADDTHGFTIGYTTLTRPDGSTVRGKYVAYWQREDGTWRIAVYRRVGRPDGEVSLEERSPALPARLVPAARDDGEHRRLVDELAQAERDFSRDANGGPTIGAAFTRYGDPSAANAGGGPAFVFGPDSIGKLVQAGIAAGTRITWWPEETRVASSGDLGVTIGIIAIEGKGASGAPQSVRVPYFTIWRRDDRTRPWRYVAE